MVVVASVVSPCATVTSLPGSPTPVTAIESPARTSAGVPKQLTFWAAAVRMAKVTTGEWTNKVANIAALMRLARAKLMTFHTPLRRRDTIRVR